VARAPLDARPPAQQRRFRWKAVEEKGKSKRGRMINKYVSRARSVPGRAMCEGGVSAASGQQRGAVTYGCVWLLFLKKYKGGAKPSPVQFLADLEGPLLVLPKNIRRARARLWLGKLARSPPARLKLRSLLPCPEVSLRAHPSDGVHSVCPNAAGCLLEPDKTNYLKTLKETLNFVPCARACGRVRRTLYSCTGIWS
jgi:hypothetical protein